ncbi:MAG: SDR family oxidoreductase [Aeoliella sp.]
MKTLIFGCGYLGSRVAHLWRQTGDDVAAVTRSEKRAAEFTDNGWRATVADISNPASLVSLPEVDTVLIAVGYDRSSDQSIEKVYAGGARNVLAALSGSVRRLIYISSTGVYGDAAGAWIDEQTLPEPDRAGGAASLAAEEAIRASNFADRSVILRLAGIYGPDRLPYLEQLKAGEPIEAQQSGHLNLIHVDDAARIVHRVAAPNFNVDLPLTYCVSDGNPVVRAEFYQEVARRLGAPPPRFVQPPSDSPRAARAVSDKLVSNRRLLEELPIELRYPSYREGLADVLRQKV